MAQVGLVVVASYILALSLFDTAGGADSRTGFIMRLHGKW
jgi:hypothetical protein